jgi:hypothetical protein
MADFLVRRLTSYPGGAPGGHFVPQRYTGAAAPAKPESPKFDVEFVMQGFVGAASRLVRVRDYYTRNEIRPPIRGIRSAIDRGRLGILAAMANFGMAPKRGTR